MKKLRGLHLPPVSFACELRARCNRLVPLEQYDHFMTHPLTGEYGIIRATRDRLCDARPLTSLPFEFYDHLALNTYVTRARRGAVAPYQVAFGLAHIELGIYAKSPVPSAAALALLLISAADFPRMLPEPGLAEALECFAPIEQEQRAMIEAAVPIARIVERVSRPSGWAQEAARLAQAAREALDEWQRYSSGVELWDWLCDPVMLERTKAHGLWQC